ncbi:MAG TPA: GHMP kinase [Patescibacteria group bacterium]|nr:GHMP kinase [Patescibacteria group bacterium]
MPRRVEARAPTRVDLAGGTVDLWPLYLLLDRPLTVNAAIDLDANASIEIAAEPGWEIVSRDRGASGRVPAGASLQEALAATPAGLSFITRLAHELLASGPPRSRPTALRITTACRAPAGSGLGGSSALGIALATALDRFAGTGLGADQILHLTRAVETQVLAIPTGEQDYHPALHGGVLALHYTVRGTRIERLDVDTAALRERILLLYTGVSRNSGISNWDIYKRYLDGDQVVRSSLQAISDAAHQVRDALIAGRWQEVGAGLADEWAARRRLSPAVTDERIDALIAGACETGASAGKVCGAGGGGCLVLWLPGDGVRGAVEGRMRSMGAEVLQFDLSASGVQVTET